MLSPVAVSLVAPEPLGDGLKVLPEHSRVNGFQKDPGFISQIVVS